MMTEPQHNTITKLVLPQSKLYIIPKTFLKGTFQILWFLLYGMNIQEKDDC
jgi:hypothetical protein